MYSLKVVKSEKDVSYCSRIGDDCFLHVVDGITPREALDLALNYAGLELNSVTFTLMLPHDATCNATLYLLTRVRITKIKIASGQ